MLVYFECFNTDQIAHACLRRIFQCRRVYLHFTYNDIYICYRWEICSKLTIKTPERRHRPRSDVFIVNFTYLTLYSNVSIVSFEQVKLARNQCYGSLSTLQQNDVIAPLSLLLILNIFHTLF